MIRAAHSCAQVRAVLPQVRDQFREQHVVAGVADVTVSPVVIVLLPCLSLIRSF